jgi:hypothetical protein
MSIGNKEEIRATFSLAIFNMLMMMKMANQKMAMDQIHQNHLISKMSSDLETKKKKTIFILEKCSLVDYHGKHHRVD